MVQLYVIEGSVSSNIPEFTEAHCFVNCDQKVINQTMKITTRKMTMMTIAKDLVMMVTTSLKRVRNLMNLIMKMNQKRKKMIMGMRMKVT